MNEDKAQLSLGHAIRPSLQSGWQPPEPTHAPDTQGCPTALHTGHAWAGVEPELLWWLCVSCNPRGVLSGHRVRSLNMQAFGTLESNQSVKQSATS